MAKEYIEREALIAEYDRVHKGPAGGARKLMVEAPAADVVEVVRCKDCEFYNTEYHFKGEGWCKNNYYTATDDHFCSCGERKEGAEE